MGGHGGVPGDIEGPKGRRLKNRHTTPGGLLVDLGP